MDYKQFRVDYNRSGMTQKEFGKIKGISSSMVSYYLSKTRVEKDNDKGSNFSLLSVSKSDDRNITIRTSAGIEIEIPI